MLSLLDSCFLLNLILKSKKEATCSSETPVYLQLTIQRYILEDRTLHNHRCENPKSYDSLNFVALEVIMSDINRSLREVFFRLQITVAHDRPVTCCVCVCMSVNYNNGRDRTTWRPLNTRFVRPDFSVYFTCLVIKGGWELPQLKTTVELIPETSCLWSYIRQRTMTNINLT
jgi:hypothetical protein